MNPSDYAFNTGGYDFTGYGYSYTAFHTPPPPKPYRWPEQEEQFPVLQEGDHGMFILTQASLGWREDALDAIVRQVKEREKLLGCELIATAECLPDGSLLVEWKRHKCEAVLGGPHRK